MTLERFWEALDVNVARQRQLLVRKGNDYRGQEDALANFKLSGFRLGLNPLQILGVYLGKHIAAVETFIAHGKVESEPIEGRIDDAVNYLQLLLALVKELKENAATPGQVEGRDQ